ncbi:MAG: hypothetical protein E6J34_09865 [Chloroflexi bacterium]|nr:MAG: hypothetical protein E6J34_09865 [Chloroflexota bacterium]
MQKPGRYILYLLPTTLVISTIILSILFGTGIVHLPKNVSAANGPISNAQSITTLRSILTLRPMWAQSVNIATTKTPVASELLACLRSTVAPICYTPQEMRQAYGVQSLLNAGTTGKGRSITLIEAFQYPTLQKDLQIFDKLFGLPDTQVTIFAPFGSVPFDFKDAGQNGFATEAALDVQWAHAMAPDAAITVIEAKDNSLVQIANALQFAVKQNIGDVISMSLGLGEQCFDATVRQQMHASFQQARTQEQTVLASAGDSGSAAGDCDVNGNIVTLTQGVIYPASDPLVTSVGGTTLLAERKTGTYKSETVWNEADQGNGATGGGFSHIFRKPDYQQSVPGTARGVSDLSFDADPLTGVPVVAGSQMPNQTLLVTVGGTSLGAPAVAGIAALFDQVAGKRLGFLNNALYRINQIAIVYAQTFHDIQSGNNPFLFKDDNNNLVFVDGFNAVVSWDAPTGVGTLIASSLALVLPQFVNANDGSNL